MPNQRILWTALPNGVDIERQKLKLSVHVSLRLQSENEKTELTSFPDFVNWPNTLFPTDQSKYVRFQVQFFEEKASSVIALSAPMQADVITTRPDSELWRSLFSPATGPAIVLSHQFKTLEQRRIRSYPARHILGFIRNLYQQIASNSPRVFPDQQTLINNRVGDNGALSSLSRINNVNDDILDRQFRRILITDRISSNSVIPANSKSQPFQDFLQLRRFHRPRNSNRLRAQELKEVQSRFIEQFDFHQALSVLSNYPILLRRLGLVHDLEINLPSELMIEKVVLVQVSAKWSSEGTVITENYPEWPGDKQRLLTRCIVSSNRFVARPRKKDLLINLPLGKSVLPLKHPMLALGNRNLFDTAQIDLDGAAIKLIDFAGNLSRSISEKTSDTPGKFSLPSLRSGGFSVFRVDRARQLATHLANGNLHNSMLESANDVILDAEDLIRGFHIDVWDNRSQWHSLCRRVGSYKLPSFSLNNIEDEGVVSTGVTQEANPSGSSDIYLQESLFRWGGWSLVAPRPGKAIDPRDKPIEISNKAETYFKLETTFKPVSGTLPSLRFGQAYSFRARAVDLAGNCYDLEHLDMLLPPLVHLNRDYKLRNNGLNQDETPPLKTLSVASLIATKPLLYSRFEPVEPPVLIKRRPITVGESLERLVIRSEFNTADAPPEWTLPSERHIAPPKISQLMSEELGKFDKVTKSNSVLDKNSYKLIVLKESGSFSQGSLDPNDYDQPYFDVDQLSLPYLPDPFAFGASFHSGTSLESIETIRGLPGVDPETVLRADFDYDPLTQWPYARPFRIKVISGDSLSSFLKNYELEVTLPPAEVAKVRLSCCFHKDPVIADLQINQMGIWQWTKEAGLITNTLLSAARLGTHWMLTPFRELLLVHAVKQPIESPKFYKPYVTRSLGETFATLIDNPGLSVHGKSTDKITINAHWEESIDAPNDGMPKGIPGKTDKVKGAGVVGEIPIIPTETSKPVSLRHEFGDTKYRRVTYSAKATTRFREYFVQRTTLKLSGTGPHLLSSGGVVEGSESVTAQEEKHVMLIGTDAVALTGGLVDGAEIVKSLDGSVSYESNKDYIVDYKTGTIRRTGLLAEPLSRISSGETVRMSFMHKYHRDQHYTMDYSFGTITRHDCPKGETNCIVDGDIVNVDYIASPITRESSPVTFDVLNSARPAIPKVLYIIPTFKWETEKEVLPEKITSKRGGGGLRVYLDRPWWSSGDGELLGVVLAPPRRYKGSDDEDFLKPYVTKWGIDPLWQSKPTRPTPLLEHFKNAVKTSINVTLDEREGEIVHVAGHEVGYDAERQLWFCDIHCDAGSSAYFPFVRLALARYQPNSVPNAHISRVMLADFVQLTPDRSATVTSDPLNSRRVVNVSVSGASYRAGFSTRQPSEMEVSVEKRHNAIEGELGWVPIEGATYQLKTITVGESDTLWMEAVHLPVPRGSEPLRLVIKEFELFKQELESAPIRRLVYADAIEI